MTSTSAIFVFSVARVIFGQAGLTSVSILQLPVSIVFNPLSPKIDFYVDLLICATSWASNHKFMLLSKIFQETYYL